MPFKIEIIRDSEEKSYPNRYSRTKGGSSMNLDVFENPVETLVKRHPSYPKELKENQLTMTSKAYKYADAFLFLLFLGLAANFGMLYKYYPHTVEIAGFCSLVIMTLGLLLCIAVRASARAEKTAMDDVRTEFIINLSQAEFDTYALAANKWADAIAAEHKGRAASDLVDVIRALAVGLESYSFSERMGAMLSLCPDPYVTYAKTTQSVIDDYKRKMEAPERKVKVI
jgi:hypothetical protein